MIVMRCAWHPKYRGYPWVYRVATWNDPSRLQFSDGMCRSCARRWHAEFWAGRGIVAKTLPPAPPVIPAWMPRVGLALALSTAVLLAARPIDTPHRMTRTDPAQTLPAEVATARLEPASPPAVEPPRIAPERSPRVKRAVARQRPPVRRAASREPACVRAVAPSGLVDCRAVSAPPDVTTALVVAQAP